MSAFIYSTIHQNVCCQAVPVCNTFPRLTVRFVTRFCRFHPWNLTLIAYAIYFLILKNVWLSSLQSPTFFTSWSTSSFWLNPLLNEVVSLIYGLDMSVVPKSFMFPTWPLCAHHQIRSLLNRTALLFWLWHMFGVSDKPPVPKLLPTCCFVTGTRPAFWCSFVMVELKQTPPKESRDYLAHLLRFRKSPPRFREMLQLSLAYCEKTTRSGFLTVINTNCFAKAVWIKKRPLVFPQLGSDRRHIRLSRKRLIETVWKQGHREVNYARAFEWIEGSERIRDRRFVLLFCLQYCPMDSD